MIEKPLIGAYWGARKETHHESVTRTLRFLQAITGKPDLARWCKPGRTRKEADIPQEISMEAIGQEMEPGTHRGKWIPDPQRTDVLGFRFYAWNGCDKASASISTHCGLYDPNPNLSNAAVLELPRQLFPGDQDSKERLNRLLNISIEIWNPDFAVVTTDERMARVCGGNLNYKGEPLIESAWILYRRGEPIFVDKTV